MAGHLLKRHNCITGSPMLSQIRGTDEEHGGGIHRLPLASARPEPGPTPRGRIRHRRQQQVASTVADRGRRGHRQDQDARSSGRASDFEWRRPAPSAAADLHSARRARDDPARPPYPGRSSRQRRRLRVRQTAILPWSGTFHSVGSRLLRLHALSIGLDSSFTILDRSDSADLLDLLRTELGLSRTASRFPRKDTCLAIYSYTVNAGCPLEETLAQSFPWCADWPNELRRLFEAYVVASSGRASSITTTSCCIGATRWPKQSSQLRSAAVSTTSSLTSTRIPIGSKPRSCWRCAPTGLVSQSSATMRNRSIRSVRQPFGTFWTFL